MFIDRAVIDENDVQIDVLLGEDPPDGRLDRRRLVPGRYDHRDDRSFRRTRDRRESGQPPNADGHRNHDDQPFFSRR